MKKRRDWIITAAVWLAILLIWHLATKLGLVSAVLVPSPITVGKTFINLIMKGYGGTTLLGHLLASFRRLLIAFLMAMALAIPLGLLSGYFGKVRAIFNSVINFLRPLPPLAYYTLLILWLGIDDSSKIMLLFLAGFAPLYIACVAAVQKVPQSYIYGAQCLGTSKRDAFLRVILPACLPEIFVGIRTAVAVEYTTLVAAEMVAATSGIGWVVLDASNYLKSDVMFVGIFIMGITGILLDMSLRLLEKKIVFWKGYV